MRIPILTVLFVMAAPQLSVGQMISPKPQLTPVPDGVEFDYIRYFYLFPTNESRRKQPILTEFTRKAREILDWTPTTSFEELVAKMVAHDLAEVEGIPQPSTDKIHSLWS